MRLIETGAKNNSPSPFGGIAHEVYAEHSKANGAFSSRSASQLPGDFEGRNGEGLAFPCCFLGDPTIP